jgi:8-oxo-dGTP pyrophosphatase MutT (NUDIX family)
MNGPAARDIMMRAAAKPGHGSSDFDLNPEAGAPPVDQLRPAAVLVAVQEIEGRAWLWLTKRSSQLKHHPGQIAFAGGKVDATDAGPSAAALREAREEIGLPVRSVEILGELAAHRTVTGFGVTPILAMVTESFEPVAEAGEVDEVFRVPFDHVLDPARYSIESRLWRGTRRYYYVVPWGPYYIWGATARILRALAEKVAP